MKESFTAKLWKVVRICAVQVVIAITSWGVTLAHLNCAQLLDREISITMNHLPFEDALHEIEDVARIKFAYSIDQLHEEPNVSLSVEKKTLGTLLDALFTPRKIRYNVHEKEAAITLKKIHEDQSSIQGGSNGVASHAEVIQVTGIVTESSRQTPMAGVNVLIKGTTNGTATDVNGKYSLMVDGNDVLIFSFIGYTSIEVAVAGRSVIDIAMNEDATSLNEVVINAGYWTVKDQERTGNIVRVKSDDIQKQPISNPLQALQGRMAGVYIQQNTGMPGGGFTVRIRGRNSIRNEGNEPLYLIDGVPYNGTSLSGSAGSQVTPDGSPFNALSPDDIESIDVLKDADATAIYGSRGANGVVLITTRKARAEKTHVDVNVYHGLSQADHFLDLLKTPQYVEMRREALRNDNYTPSPSTDADIVSWDTTRYTDWQKELIGGTAQTSNARLSLSGGNANTQFLISGGYFKQTTVFPGDFGNEKMSALVNLSHNAENDRFNVAFSANYVYDKNNLVRRDPTFYITLPPNAPSAFNTNGELNWENGTWINPYALLMRPYEGRTGNLVSSLGLKYRLLEGLSVKANMGYAVVNASQFAAEPIKTNSPTSSVKTGSSTFSENNISTWSIEPQVEYQRTIGKANLNMLVGTTFQQQMQTGSDVRATGYSSDALLKNIKAAASLSIIDAREILYRYNSLFARINFNWDEKYIVNLTARRDGSSRFGKENQFANFGAAGVAWIFSKESAFESTSWLSFGKLRSSYGITGSDQIGDYQYLDTYKATSRTYQGQGGLIPSRLANPSYSWETNLKFEVALELGLFKDRVRLSSSWFRNQSSDQLVGYSLPSITGFTSVQYNLPATVQNTGWEWEVSSTNIDKDNLSWTTALNVTRPRNKLVDYPNLEGSSYVYFYEVGKSLYIRKMFHFTGVDPETGLYTFQDKNENGSGTDNPDDLQARKEIAQEYFGGVQNTLAYKRFELSFLFQFVKQTGSSHFTSANFVAPGRQGNQVTEVMNRWQRPDDVTDIQKFTAYYASDAARIYSTSTYAGDQGIVDASFIRLQNIYFGWSLPSEWLRKVKINSARLYCQGQNIFTLTNYPGLNPETQSQSVLPPMRVLTFGIQLSL